MREPPAPTHLQHLRQVLSVNSRDDESRGEDAEATELPRKGCGVALLEGVVETPVPGVQQDQDVDCSEVEQDDGRQQSERPPALVGPPVRHEQLPGFAAKAARMRGPRLGLHLRSSTYGPG